MMSWDGRRHWRPTLHSIIKPALFRSRQVLRYGATISESTRSGLKPARSSDWIGLSSVLRPRQNSIGPGRRRLWSSFMLQLHILPYHLSTAGRHSYPVAASIFWNTLPDDVQSAPSVSSFRRQLKTFLFHQSFPDIII